MEAALGWGRGEGEGRHRTRQEGREGEGECEVSAAGGELLATYSRRAFRPPFPISSDFLRSPLLLPLLLSFLYLPQFFPPRDNKDSVAVAGRASGDRPTTPGTTWRLGCFPVMFLE